MTEQGDGPDRQGYSASGRTGAGCRGRCSRSSGAANLDRVRAGTRGALQRFAAGGGPPRQAQLLV